MAVKKTNLHLLLRLEFNHMRKESIRVFVGPTEIAGVLSNLAKGIKANGVECDFITYRSHPFGYGGESHLPLMINLSRWFDKCRENPRRFYANKVFFSIPGEVVKHIWALCAIFRYDVFIFGFGESLMRWNIDLPLLKWLGKTVISNISFGSEARPPFIGGLKLTEDINKYSHLIRSRTARISKTVQWHQKYASIVIGAAFSTSQFARSRFINSFALGLPFDSGHSQPLCDQTNVLLSTPVLRSIRILHSPSNPVAKGTAQIVKAIENLKARGHKIDFILLHGKPFKEVLKEIQYCDFVVDQIYSDTPMAGFATESAFFGKPAIVGGYGFDLLKQFVPYGMWPPSKTCHPDQIEQAIEEFITNADLRKSLGREAQSFVREKWSTIEVGKRFLQLIEGDIPNDWWLNPNDVVYTEGAGQSIERSQQTIRKLVANYGLEALQLEHRPDLQKAFIEFANVN
jgi:glycosyltransferase involved in cell wall biosynthesis